MTTDVAADLADLYKAVIAKAKGDQVQSVGHKGRTAAYADASLADLIKLYRMLWFKGCGSPELPADLDASVATRGCYRVRLIG